jgi:hypothetical protein
MAVDVKIGEIVDPIGYIWNVPIIANAFAMNIENVKFFVVGGGRIGK